MKEILLAPFFLLAATTSAYAQCPAPRYRIGKILRDDRVGTTIQISIPVRDFAPRRLACLAQVLKQRYHDRSSLDVLIFSSHDAAKKWIVLTMHSGPQAFKWETYFHGAYSYDPLLHEEYINISPDPLQSQIGSRTETQINLPIVGPPQCKIQLNGRCLLVLPAIWPFRHEAVWDREWGSVALAGKVAPNGRIGDIRVVESLLSAGENGDFLKKVAIQNLKAWRFEAASHPDAIRMTYEYRYTPPGPAGRTWQMPVKMELPDKSVVEMNLSILKP